MNTQIYRYVKANVISSSYLPRIRIKIDDAFLYVGKLQFNLYQRALVDLFLFADASGKKIERLIWVQFEGKLDSDDQTYNYPTSPTVTLGVRDFYYNSAVFKYTPYLQEHPFSDVSKGVNFLRKEGFKLEDEVMYHRYVNVVDEEKRNELIISYIEGLSVTGFTVADLREGGTAKGKWRSLAKELHKKANESFVILEC